MNTSDSIVIIPTYNEKENMEKIVRAVFSLDKCFHILVIDDGSPDGTAFSNKEFLTVDSVGIWGSAEVIGSHAVITANQHQSGDYSGLMLVRSYLNHRINAPKTTPESPATSLVANSEMARMV